ncbi:MAG TPA: tetratricopeptide repeat protein [Candidatus Polarisedimenticolia bacterium]|nr:tetratricopeptide repeat protein [Candidatus Polarisedimenticolia bacterium]
MSSRSAEMSFRKGLQALDEKRHLESLAYFESALNLEEKSGNPAPRMKYLSYYGLSLSLAAGRTQEAIEMCEKALSVEFYNPDLYLNVARVYLTAGERRRAHKALCQGLRIEKGHAGLIAEIRRMGVRRRPVFGFLPRHHVLNRLTGAFVSRLR